MVGVVAAVGAVKWRRSALGDVDGDSLRGASGGDSAVNTSPREDNSPPSPMIKNQAFQGPDDAIPAAVYAKLEGPDSRGVADKPAGVYDRVGASPALHEDPHAGPESNTYVEPDPFVGLRNNTVYAVVGLMDLAAGGGVGQADYATLGANSSAKRGAASALAAGTYAELVPVAGSLPTATYATLDYGPLVLAHRFLLTTHSHSSGTVGALTTAKTTPMTREMGTRTLPCLRPPPRRPLSHPLTLSATPSAKTNIFADDWFEETSQKRQQPARESTYLAERRTAGYAGATVPSPATPESAYINLK